MYTYTYIVTCVFLIVGLRTTFRKNIKLNYAYVGMNSYLAQVLMRNNWRMHIMFPDWRCDAKLQIASRRIPEL